MKGIWRCAALFAALACGSGAARAAELGWGVRAGITAEPATYLFGLHLGLAEFLPAVPRLSFEPSFEVGFGDQEIPGIAIEEFSFTSVGVNATLKYLVLLDQFNEFEVHPLAGVRYQHVSFSDCEGRGVDCSQSGTGVSVGAGAGYKRFSVDVAAGFGDVPDFTFTALYTLGLR